MGAGEVVLGGEVDEAAGDDCAGELGLREVVEEEAARVPRYRVEEVGPEVAHGEERHAPLMVDHDVLRATADRNWFVGERQVDMHMT
jgi:hypothetical protein